MGVRPGLARDLLLRAAGLVMLACCWLLMAWLVRGATVRPYDAPGALSYLAGAAAYLCFALGGMLTALGEHVFDKVLISRRWVRQDAPSRVDSRAGD